MLVCIAGIARAEIALAPLFADHAVLQRDKPVPVWGRADPDAQVTVSFQKQTATAIAEADGRWTAWLKPLSASSEPEDMIVSVSDGGGRQTIRVRDILVGEVWLCSGQSNMEWPVKQAQNAEREIASANNPLIRHISIKQRVAKTPMDTVPTGGWKSASPETAGDFTAAGYFFAREMQPRLGVPVGLVNSSMGGGIIEGWMPDKTLTDNPAFAVITQRWQQILDEYPAKKAEYDAEMQRRAKAGAQQEDKSKPVFPRINPPIGPGHKYTPSGLHNGSIHPLIPYALRGVLWYQGEMNAGRPEEYNPLFSAMIKQWREDFGQGNIPFLWVQLPNFKSGDPAETDWARLREAQTQTLSLPATGQAVTIDIGDVEDIHPKNKQDVGLRLALLARALVYGEPVECTGPVFDRASREGAAMRVHFSTGAKGLVLRKHSATAFQLAGADKEFHPAEARVENDTVIVTSTKVPAPVAVRYAWFNAPEASLYNAAALPAGPFRSDNW
ncbi:sialate O-acetylesterase [Ereboglobus luteus]|uniref:sialate O-acetylesterase n=1 Tax=Ereboglobus luteus TaxID=1796921 RepID=UPI001F372461|nr:sialate O-acetylesterase [Ereboglobus luteus]